MFFWSSGFSSARSSHSLESGLYTRYTNYTNWKRESRSSGLYLHSFRFIISIPVTVGVLPSGSWAAGGLPWRACVEALSPGVCCTQSGWWAQSGAVSEWAPPVSSGWCSGAWTPALAWTHGVEVAWHVPGPSVSAACLTPSKHKQKTINLHVEILPCFRHQPQTLITQQLIRRRVLLRSLAEQNRINKDTSSWKDF